MRHRRLLAPINTIKHFVPLASVPIATGAINNHKIAEGVAAPATTLVSDVIQGAIVKAVYVEMWLASNEASGTESQFILTIEKKRATEVDMTNAQALNLQSYFNKKNILYTTQGILNSNTVQGTVPVVRQWIAIPKGKQRFGLADEFLVNIAAVGSLQVCGMTIYKEYR